MSLLGGAHDRFEILAQKHTRAHTHTHSHLRHTGEQGNIAARVARSRSRSKNSTQWMSYSAACGMHTCTHAHIGFTCVRRKVRGDQENVCVGNARVGAVLIRVDGDSSCDVTAAARRAHSNRTVLAAPTGSFQEALGPVLDEGEVRAPGVVTARGTAGNITPRSAFSAFLHGVYSYIKGRDKRAH